MKQHHIDSPEAMKHTVLHIVLFTLIITLSCTAPVMHSQHRHIIISVAPGLLISTSDFAGRLKQEPGPSNGNDIEVLILSYSSGKEIFTLSNSSQERITVRRTSGSIEALIKIREDHILKDVYFLKASGRSKGEIIGNFITELKRTLR
jgi:hypothetical protein